MKVLSRRSFSCIAAAFVALAAPAACGRPERPVGLTDILDRNAEARGGKAAIEAIASIRIEVTVTEPDFSVRGQYVATRDGDVRVDIFDGETRVFTEALGADVGWQMFGDGTVAEMSEDGRNALRRGLIGNLYGLHEREGLGHRLDWLGLNDAPGGLRHVIVETEPSGFRKIHYIDPESFLVVATSEISALHPDRDATQTEQTTYAKGFAEVAGVTFETGSIKKDSASGNIIQETTVQSREVNVAVGPEFFARPASSDD
ncbi:MAG: hypothetical protein GC152_15420 [Alphaproteobacteria bacterium]|nr:hypothetical protein [Alphaproteobacteria bacterium]